MPRVLRIPPHVNTSTPPKIRKIRPGLHVQAGSETPREGSHRRKYNAPHPTKRTDNATFARVQRTSVGLFMVLFRLHLAADTLGLAEDAQQVAAENFPYIASAVAAVEQRLRDLREIGGGVNALGSRAADAVEIRSQANMIHARDFGDVIDVVDQRAQRRPRNLGIPLALDAISVEIGGGFAGCFQLLGVGPGRGLAVFRLRLSRFAEALVDKSAVEIYLDDAAVFSDGTKHVIGHVAGMIGESASRGMRGDHWRFADRDRVIESLVGDVGDVD